MSRLTYCQLILESVVKFFWILLYDCIAGQISNIVDASDEFIFLYCSIFILPRNVILKEKKIFRVCNKVVVLRHMRLIFYAHHSRARKQIKLSGSCLSTIYGFGSTQLSENLMSYRCSDIFLTK